LQDGLRSGHIDRRCLAAGRGHLVVADAGEMGAVLLISLTPVAAGLTHIWKYAKQSILQLCSSLSLDLPIQLVELAFQVEYGKILPLEHLG